MRKKKRPVLSSSCYVDRFSTHLQIE